MIMSAIDAQNLSKHYEGVYALNNLSAPIPKGKIMGVIGPNGSGKSTLINLLTGISKFDHGTVSFDSNIKFNKINPPEVSNFGVARTFQETRLFEQMTVLDNILVVTTERKILRSIFEKHGQTHLAKAKQVLKRVHLWEKKNEMVFNLSYGQRKLLEIARVLATKYADDRETSIFLFDEPFAGLFPQMRKTVASIIKGLQQKGKTVVLIEHDMDLIKELCEYLLVLDEGKLLAEGRPDEIIKKKEVIEAYIGK